MRSTIPIGPSSLAIGSRRAYADLNSVFQSLFHETPTPRRSRQTALRANLSVLEDAFHLKAEIPGVKREDIELSVLGDVLTLSGDFGPSVECSEGEACPGAEGLRSGSFRRQFQLPGLVDVQGVSATHVDGILSVRLPKAASAMAQRIEVQGEQAKT